jgi:hypothetical protein
MTPKDSSAKHQQFMNNAKLKMKLMPKRKKVEARQTAN